MVIFLLALCVLLSRLILVMKGGLFFFPDEKRYELSLSVGQSILQGEWKEAIHHLMTSPEHPAFKFWFSFPMALELHWGWKLGTLSILVNAALSSAAVFFLAAIVYELAPLPKKRIAATVLLGISLICPSLQYYARHLLSFELSMFWILCGAWVSLRALRVRSDALALGMLFVSGASAAMGIWSYFGYWFLGVLTPSAWLLGEPCPVWVALRHRWRWALASLAGAIAVCGGILGACTWAGDVSYYFSRIGGFSQKINQGDFSDGPALVLTWLAWVEPGLIAASFAVVFLIAWRKQFLPMRRLLLTALSLLFALFFFSWGLHKFVMYGRLARQLAYPLVIYCTLGCISVQNSRAKIILSLLLLFSLFPLWKVWEMEFPQTFLREVEIRYGEGVRTSHLFEPPWNESEFPRSREIMSLNTQYFSRLDHPRKVFPDHEVLMESPHPQEWKPFQLEGFPSWIEAAFDEQIHMKLVRFK